MCHWPMFTWIPRTTKKLKVMCVSSPVYPVIIGNVRDARQMLPEPEWKAEVQKGARATASGGNNNNGDTKVVICLVGCSKWSPTEGKQKIETQRRSQPRSKKMLIMLHKVSKSKKAPQKESVFLHQF